MTEKQLEQARKEAEADAESLGLLLLVAMERRDASDLNAVSFDSRTGKFRFKGRTVSIASIRSYLLRIENGLAGRVLRLTNDLEAGRISEGEWKDSFDRAIKSSHILAGALALGGIGVAMKNATLVERVDSEIAYADNFAKEIRTENAGSVRKIRARAKSYFMSSHITFSILEQTLREVGGFQTEAMRIRRAAESCKGCIRFSNRWIAIELMPPIGSLQCRGYCRCYLVYR